MARRLPTRQRGGAVDQPPATIREVVSAGDHDAARRWVRTRLEPRERAHEVRGLSAGELARLAAMLDQESVAKLLGSLPSSDAARLLGCAPDEIALSGSNSGSWQTAIAAMRFGPGDRILVGRSEWGGNYGALLRIARLAGATVEEIPVNEFGETCAERLQAMLDERVRLISLTWLPCNGGLINPAAQVGRRRLFAQQAGQVAFQPQVHQQHAGFRLEFHDGQQQRVAGAGGLDHCKLAWMKHAAVGGQR